MYRGSITRVVWPGLPLYGLTGLSRTNLIISPQIDLQTGLRTSPQIDLRLALRPGPGLSISVIRLHGLAQLPNGCHSTKIG